ncbi:MAG: hypothetical protein OEU92_19920, partial [Alphaproteobacteria bacterium]|nr:hypothetical protein [Alphaproteobacteria bacterium]
MLRYRWVGFAVVTMSWMLAGGWPSGKVAASEQPCDRLFVPEGYALTCTVERKPGDDAWEVSVHPTDGTFASLS